MSDTISRQAAIDALEREQSLVERPITETRWFDLGLRKAQEVLSKLPSAQPDCSDCIKHGGDWDCDHMHCHKGKYAQPEWIPCNWQAKEENLPRECKSVLICMKDSCGYRIGVSYRTDYNRWEGYGRVNVIAWMPLPEPYAERRTDETDS